MAFVTLLCAHDLIHKVSEQKSIVVHLSFGNDDDFSYEPYEVFYADEKMPYSVGRTDKHSQLLLLPDRAGEWYIKVMSDDGHGKVIAIVVDENFSFKDNSQPLYEKFLKIFVGVSIIFFIFTVIQFKNRRKNEKNGSSQ